MKMNLASKFGQFLPMLLLASLFTFAGCASHKESWDTRVGHYTYDQAVADYGPPDKQATLSNGNTMAEWVRHRGGGVSVGLGTGYYGSHSGVGVGVGHDVTGPNVEILRLTFGQDGRLTDYSKQ